MYNSGYFSVLTVTVFTRLTNCIGIKRAHLNFHEILEFFLKRKGASNLHIVCHLKLHYKNFSSWLKTPNFRKNPKRFRVNRYRNRVIVKVFAASGLAVTLTAIALALLVTTMSAHSNSDIH